MIQSTSFWETAENPTSKSCPLGHATPLISEIRTLLFFNYLKNRFERKSFREADLIPAGHSLKGHVGQGFARLQLRSWNFILVSHMGYRGPGSWVIFCCILRFISHELDQKWSSSDLNLCSWGILAPRLWLNLLCHDTGQEDCYFKDANKEAFAWGLRYLG